jgi:hypothetical protein
MKLTRSKDLDYVRTLHNSLMLIISVDKLLIVKATNETN